MRRPHFHPYTCKVCKKTRDEVGHISQTGLCPEHSKQRFMDNLDGLKTMSGPHALHWRRAMAASVGAVLPLDTSRMNGKPSGDA